MLVIIVNKIIYYSLYAILVQHHIIESLQVS